MAQTTITYTYDSAGNRTGRSASVQTLAGVSDIPSVESVAISKIVSQLMATPVNGVLLSKEADSIPDRRETALWAACPFPEEQRNQQILKIIEGLRGDDESGNRFEAVVNEDMNGIMDQFRQDYPSFSEQDYRLFCYYVAGFSTKTISIIVRNLSADAIYMRKSRMKKHIQESDCPRRETYLEYL